MTDIPPLLRRVLAARGLVDDAAVETYLNPSFAALPPPSRLPGVEEAAAGILPFVTARRPIVVFGDYDCDGVCATAILVRTLTALGGDVRPFLPERLTEGYGMSEASVGRLLETIPDAALVITVDNGINSVDEIASLVARGISVIVTDHHLPGDRLPDCPIVNPKVAADEAFSGLCGAGVAFLVASELVALARREGVYAGGKVSGPLTVLAGLATVTDIMPLVGVNRILVAEALKRFRTLAPIGLRELYDRAAHEGAQRLVSRDFGFLLGPRMNAVGRLGSAVSALDLLLVDDREKARRAAFEVDQCNVERRSIEQGMTEEAVGKIVPDAAGQVIDLPDGHLGIAGIVAARLLERTGVPSCVIVRGRGSARAPEGFNLRDAFVEAAETLDRFGGHAAAGGFSVREGRLDDFRELFVAACAKQSGGRTGRTLPEGLEIAPSDLTIDDVAALARMEPFGEGNPEPVFVFRAVRLESVRPLGANGRGLQLAIGGLRAVWWNHGEDVERLRASRDRFDVYFTAQISTFGGSHVEIRLIDLEPVGA